MSRYSAPPPNGDSRKAIEARSREATRPAHPKENGRWPFVVNTPSAAEGEKSLNSDANNANASAR